MGSVMLPTNRAEALALSWTLETTEGITGEGTITTADTTYESNTPMYITSITGTYDGTEITGTDAGEGNPWPIEVAPNGNVLVTWHGIDFTTATDQVYLEGYIPGNIDGVYTTDIYVDHSNTLDQQHVNSFTVSPPPLQVPWDIPSDITVTEIGTVLAMSALRKVRTKKKG